MKENELFGFFCQLAFCFYVSLKSLSNQNIVCAAGSGGQQQTGASVYCVEAGVSTKPVGLASDAPSQP
jgi:hypothetical protein